MKQINARARNKRENIKFFLYKNNVKGSILLS
jgi:hypothetical protein